MKITPKQYAQSLYEVLKGKSKNEVKDYILNFFNTVVNNNDISKLERIIEQFEKKWNKEEGIIDAEIVSSRKLEGDIIKLVKNYIKKISGAKEVNILEKEDKKVLGGIVIKYEDKVLDASLKTKLNDLKLELSK